MHGGFDRREAVVVSMDRGLPDVPVLVDQIVIGPNKRNLLAQKILPADDDS